MTPDVNVVLLDFPVAGKEMVFENEDGTFTIMINSRLSYEGQLNAYRHAVRHINNNDFQKDNTQAIEATAHDIVHPVEAHPIPANKFLQRLNKIRGKRKRIQRELQKLEDHLKIILSIKEYNDFELSDSQEWYGNKV